PRSRSAPRRQEDGGPGGARREHGARRALRGAGDRRAGARGAPRSRRPAAAADVQRARGADRERAPGRNDGGGGDDQPRDRPVPVRDRKDGGDPPSSRLRQARDQLAPRAASRAPGLIGEGLPETPQRDGAFPDLTEDQIARLREMGTVREVEQGEVLFAEGD